MSKLLVVDDNRNWMHNLVVGLELEGYDVTSAYDGEQALRLLDTVDPDLVVLDIEMPGMDGHEVCKRLRRHSNVPVLFLSVHGNDPEHVVPGLGEGGDDAMSKMTSIAEIKARIEAILRRANGHHAIPDAGIYDDGHLHIDLYANHVAKSGEPVQLTPTELKLLTVLVRNKGMVVPHAQLLLEVWGPDYTQETNYLAIFVRYLRVKLEQHPSDPKYIITKHRLGYAFMPGPHNA